MKTTARSTAGSAHQSVPYAPFQFLPGQSIVSTDRIAFAVNRRMLYTGIENHIRPACFPSVELKIWQRVGAPAGAGCQVMQVGNRHGNLLGEIPGASRFGRSPHRRDLRLSSATSFFVLHHGAADCHHESDLRADLLIRSSLGNGTGCPPWMWSVRPRPSAGSAPSRGVSRNGARVARCARPNRSRLTMLRTGRRSLRPGYVVVAIACAEETG